MAAQGLVLCELCVNQEEGQWFCRNCNQSLCDTCKISHLRANISKHHDVILRREMFNTQGEMARPVDEFCKEHEKELYILYCRRCQKLICKKCLTRDHTDHGVTEIEEIFKEHHQLAQTVLKELLKRDQAMTGGSSGTYADLKKEVVAETEKIKSEFERARDKLLENLKRHCESLDVNGAVTKLNKAIQRNRTSDLIEALRLGLAVLKAAETYDQKLAFEPQNHEEKHVLYLLGQFTVSNPRYSEEVKNRIVDRGGVVHCADLDVVTMTLRYNFPNTLKGICGATAAQLIGPNPFSRTLKTISIRIQEEGERREVGIGLVPQYYPKYKMPGWNPQSYGYHSDDGGIYMGHPLMDLRCDPCYKGDVMVCKFDISNGKLEFYKNTRKVFETIISRNVQYFPMIGMRSKGMEVVLLEEAPWLM